MILVKTVLIFSLIKSKTTWKVFFSARMIVSKFFQIRMAATIATPIPIIISVITPIERFSPMKANLAPWRTGVIKPIMPENPAIIGPAAIKIGASTDAFSMSSPLAKAKSLNDALSLSVTVMVLAWASALS